MNKDRMTLLRQETQTNKDVGVRCFSGNIRATEETEGSRKMTVSFSSEEPYTRWFGPEILDHTEGAMDLGRLNEIGVLLFNHDVDRVCGKIHRAWNEESRGIAEVEFDTDEDAEKIYQKVKNGTLKATSVRYSVEEWEEVKEGKKSEDGKYEGPCWIARKWTPLEVSIVSVPADASVGVGREFTPETPKEEAPKKQAMSGRSINELQLQLNKSTNTNRR